MRLTTLMLIGLMGQTLAACGEMATLTIAAGTGPQPTLPAPGSRHSPAA